jgi:hypothetical protein
VASVAARSGPLIVNGHDPQPQANRRSPRRSAPASLKRYDWPTGSTWLSSSERVVSPETTGFHFESMS